MIRIVRTSEGTMLIDPEQKQNGRSVYLCRQMSCLEKAQKRRSLERGLKMPAGSEIREALKKEIESSAAG